MITYKRRRKGKACLGCKTIVKIDYPKGSKRKDGKVRELDYGYVPVDGKKLRAFVLDGVGKVEYEGVVIGVVYYQESNENSLVVASEGSIFNQAQIMLALNKEIDKPYLLDCLYEKSCGAVVYTRTEEGIRYLILQDSNGYCGLAKGHAEPGETEKETALREVWEETSIRAQIHSDFRREVSFKMRGGITKTVVYFIAEFSNQVPHQNEGFEPYTHLLVDEQKAIDLLTFENTKQLIQDVNDVLTKN